MLKGQGGELSEIKRASAFYLTLLPAFVLLGHCWAKKVAWWPLPQLLPATKSHDTTTVLIPFCTYSVHGSAINWAGIAEDPTCEQPEASLRATISEAEARGAYEIRAHG